MSKRPSYQRGRSYWRRRMAAHDAIRKAWGYRDYLTNEIEELKLRGPSKHLSKLRKYLKRTV